MKELDWKPIEQFFSSRGWKPLPFQKSAWEAVASGESGLLYVPTGSGKTYAATMPLFASFLSCPRKGLKALYITPLRALARDIEAALKLPVEEQKWPIKVEARTGDTSYARKSRQLVTPADLLLTTPESLAILISQPDSAKILSKIETVIVDEWHELLSTKRGSLLELSLSYLRTLNPDLQTWALSASIGNIDEAAQAIVGQDCKPTIITGGRERDIEVQCLLPEKLDRFPWGGHLGFAMKEALLKELDPEVSTLIFTNTRSQAERWFQLLTESLPEMEERMALHHSSLDRDTRESVEEGVKIGDLKWVVCTSSLDLGVDFQQVERVVQIGSPKMVARMLQRGGRSAHRPGGKSRLLFVPTNAWEIMEFEAFKMAVRENHIEPRRPLQKPKDVLIQHMTTLACGAGLSIEELWQALQHSYSFREITREELNWCLQFLTTGGKTLQRYPQYHKLTYDPSEGRYFIANGVLARQHRMSIGTIVNRETAMISYMNRSRIGSVDESFVAKLKPGDIFQFAGKKLQFIKLRDMTAYVKASRLPTNVIPSWGGNRFPISETLAQAFRETLHAPHPGIERLLKPLLGTQEAMSELPKPNTFLIEMLSAKDGEHFLAYPFEGRLVHEGLAQFWALKFADREPGTFSFSVNDYGFEIFGHKGYPFKALFDDDFFAHDQLQSEIPRSLHISQLSQRQFREIAQIAGLVFTGYPGSPKSGKQKQVSSSLLYEIFKKYDEGNLLVKQSYDEVLFSSLEVDRLVRTLQRLAKLKTRWVEIESPSPLAFPLLIETIARSTLSNETLGKESGTFETHLGDAGVKIRCLDQHLHLLPERAVYWEQKGILFLSDVHLGKAESFQMDGVALPAEAGESDLLRLDRLVQEIQPQQVVIVGDFVHAPRSLSLELKDRLLDFFDKHQKVEWRLVVGNHERGSLAALGELGIEIRGEDLEMAPFVFSHGHKTRSVSSFRIEGHLHPILKFRDGPMWLRLPSFVLETNRLILPAFGTWTGGVEPELKSDHRYFVAGPTGVFEWKRSSLA